MAPSFHSPRLRPVLSSEFWSIGPALDLPELRPANPPNNPSEYVDHHLFQDLDGVWHCWGCIRGVTAGRRLHHWEADSLEQSPWRATGEILRPEHNAGESLADWEGQDWIQSPFVVKDSSCFYFFYGGHSTGLDRQGRKVSPGDPAVECQICLMTSTDGRNWERHRNEQGYSRLFAGPGEARDPCVLRIGGLWYLYYAGYESGDPFRPGIYLRNSIDLIHWSEASLVHRTGQFGQGRWTHECPHVVRKDNFFYLFRTEDYDHARTHIFWSEDPTDFGVDRDAPQKYLGLLPLAAPEVIVDQDGGEYITSCHDLINGIRIYRLNWIDMDTGAARPADA